MTWLWIVSVILALGVVGVPGMAVVQRIKTGKGIGWQVIRFTVIAASLPIVCILALHDALTGEAATIVGAALAYAFGHSGYKNSTRGEG